MGSPDVADRHLAQDALTRIGHALAAVRVSRGLTQYGAGQLVGVSQQSIARIENGTAHRLGPIIRYAQALGYELEISLVEAP